MMVGAVVIGAALKVVCDERMTFDAELPEKRATGDVNVRENSSPAAGIPRGGA